METVCQQCGDKGFENAFVFCIKCLNFAVHRYCLTEVPETFDEVVHWLCDDCEPRSLKQSSLKKPCSIPSTREDHVNSKCVRVTHSKVKLKRKDIAGGVEAEENACQSSPLREPSGAKTKHDLVTHTLLACDSSSLKKKLKTIEMDGICPVTVSEEKRHQSRPLQQSSELLNKIAFTDHAQLDSDCALPKNKLKKIKGVTCTVPDTEDQSQQSKSSQQRCETQTKLDLTDSDKLGGDCSSLKDKFKRKKKDVTPSISESEEHKHQEEEKGCCAFDSNARTDPALGAGSTSSLNENGTFHPFVESCANDLKLGKQRSLVLEEGSVLGEYAESVRTADSQTTAGDMSNILERNCHLRAQPVINPIWRGSFSTCNNDYDLSDGVVAHLSSKACPKVCEEAALLPASLCLEVLQKTAVWPKSFQRSEPSDDNIALYFFPRSTRCERVFDRLVDDMINQELAMRAMLRNAELLVFTSTELPLLYWRFKGKYYLWGVFRKKQPTDTKSNIKCVKYSKSPNCVGTGDVCSPLSPLSNSGSYQWDVELESEANESDELESNREQVAEHNELENRTKSTIGSPFQLQQTFVDLSM